MNWKQECLHRVHVSSFVDMVPQFTACGFLWQHLPPSTSSESSTQRTNGGKRWWGISEMWKQVMQRVWEDYPWRRDLWIFRSAAKGMRNVCWYTCTGVGNWICYFVLLTALRNATGFFTVWNGISSMAYRLSTMVMDRCRWGRKPNNEKHGWFSFYTDVFVRFCSESCSEM